jgi:hypothetical protein
MDLMNYEGTTPEQRAQAADRLRAERYDCRDAVRIAEIDAELSAIREVSKQNKQRIFGRARIGA